MESSSEEEEESYDDESEEEEEEGSEGGGDGPAARPTRRAAKAAGRAIRKQAGGGSKRRKQPRRAAAPGACRAMLPARLWATARAARRFAVCWGRESEGTVLLTCPVPPLHSISAISCRSQASRCRGRRL